MTRRQIVRLEKLDACLLCGTPKDQHRRDQKLRPGKFPCLHGGSHKFTVRAEPTDPTCRACDPEYRAHSRHTCQD